MTTEHPAPPPENEPEPEAPAWVAQWTPPEPRQAALPIPEETLGDAILYPSDPTRYPAAIEPAAPPPQRPAYDAPTAPYFLDDQPPPPSPEPARSGLGRGLLLGLLLGAVIAAAGFGLGRLTADSEEPVADTVAATTTATSLVVANDPPPVAVVPQLDGSIEPVAAAAAAVSPAVVQLDTSTGTGSGVIYDAKGYILTAAHVVGNATNVAVRFADGSSTSGTVVGADDTTDVAVVSIDPSEVPAVAVLAVGADLSVGQTAVAVGSPFRLDQTVTSGIISAVDRIVDFISMVQTDAAINPGNSGGPLVDLSGRVLGINDVIFTNSGDNAGVGFAISIDLAKIIADQITAGEAPSLALLGVSVGSSPDGDAGGLVQDVSADTAAAAAGIEVGDLIIAIDNDPIRDSEELRAEIITRAPGSVIDLVVLRNGTEIAIQVTLGSVQTGSN
ncbi:MAG: trypsin-like peptidase domain-containing protein [Acidimicrobiia bacterium]|nr:trypsin-like peptidase domain-containing protein [Acidimicrobiia bacterium]